MRKNKQIILEYSAFFGIINNMSEPYSMRVCGKVKEGERKIAL